MKHDIVFYCHDDEAAVIMRGINMAQQILKKQFLH